MLADSYGYEPTYFARIEKETVTALIPMMAIRSALTGRRGVSLPFTDTCEPLIQDPASFPSLLKQIYRFGKEAGWKTVELRGGQRHLTDKIFSSQYVTHTLALDPMTSDVRAGFRSSTRRNIKKAEKAGVEIDAGTTPASITAFYRLHCITRKRHGLPPQPRAFFKNIHQHVLSKQMGIVVTARFEGQPVAAAVFFHFNGNAIYKYGASDVTHQHHRANNAVMDAAIKHYRELGMKTFSFGRTSPENHGLLQFKRGWGAEEQSVKYFCYDPRHGSYIKSSNRADGWSSLFKRLPLPMLRFTGTLLYRHVG